MEKTMTSSAAESRSNVKRLVMTALLAALACVATLILKVPSPSGGYMNLGDTVVLLSAYLLGPVYGAAAAGVGSMMADILAAYPVYAPATLVIKAIMAVVAALMYRKLKGSALGVLACGVIGEIPMVVGYWLFDGFLAGSLTGAAVGIPSNLVQAAFGLIVSTVLVLSLRKSGYVRKEFPHVG